MKWCCDDFKVLVLYPPELGFRVFVSPQLAADTGQPLLFHLGCRCVAQDDVPRFLEAWKGRCGIPRQILSTCTGLRFCPCCGTELAKAYQDTWRELVDQRVAKEFGLSV
jgi:hypothetical protein